MDFLLTVIAVASLTLNILIYKHLRSQNQGAVLTVEEQCAPGTLNRVNEFGEPQRDSRGESQEVEAPSVVATIPENKHQAWVNRKDIPLTETVYVPARPAPVPAPRPLERPGGFAL